MLLRMWVFVLLVVNSVDVGQCCCCVNAGVGVDVGDSDKGERCKITF